MPYIKQARRKELTPLPTPLNAGELNYVVTMLIKDYFKRMPSYQGINDIVGALDNAALEFNRRITIPYERNKTRENGDVY